VASSNGDRQLSVVTAPTEARRTARLPGGTLDYVLRRSARARSLRVVIDPARGVVVTVPGPGRRGWGRPEQHVEAFLAERDAWLRRHLGRHAAQRAVLAARGGLRDGGTLRYRGDLHRLRVQSAPPGTGRSGVSRIGGDDGDELVVRLTVRERRPVASVLEAWLRLRAREAIEAAIARHAGALGVRPGRITVRDQRTRWGSASRSGGLAFSWRLVLAPPEALETVVIHELAHLRVFGHGPAFWEIVAARRPDHAVWRRWLRDNALELHGALDDPAEAEVEHSA
jgi:predicted metal-dependent hydrolase